MTLADRIADVGIDVVREEVWLVCRRAGGAMMPYSAGGFTEDFEYCEVGHLTFWSPDWSDPWVQTRDIELVARVWSGSLADHGSSGIPERGLETVGYAGESHEELPLTFLGLLKLCLKDAFLKLKRQPRAQHGANQPRTETEQSNKRPMHAADGIETPGSVKPKAS